MATTTVNVNVAAAGSSGQVQFNNGGVFGADSAFHWDNTNKRFGVGVTPTVTLDVKGSATSGFDAIKFQSQYGGVGYLGTDNNRAWLSSGANSAGGSVAVESSQVRLRSTNTVFFNNSGVEIARFNQTNLHIGPVATPGARLDVRAQGALSTDIAFRVRNSADTINSVEYNGNGSKYWRAHTGDMHLMFDPANNRIHLKRTGIYAIACDNAVTELQVSCNTGNFLCGTGSQQFYAYATGNFHLGGNTRLAGSGSGNLIFLNGTPPSSNVADRHYYYSADIVSGNAAPHFRTENGSIIKLYQQSSAGITTVADLVTILQNIGLLS